MIRNIHNKVVTLICASASVLVLSSQVLANTSGKPSVTATQSTYVDADPRSKKYFQHIDRSLYRLTSVYNKNNNKDRKTRVDRLEMSTHQKWQWVNVLDTSYFNSKSRSVKSVTPIDADTLLVNSRSKEQDFIDNAEPIPYLTLINSAGEVLHEVAFSPTNYLMAVEGNFGGSELSQSDMVVTADKNIYLNSDDENGHPVATLIRIEQNKIIHVKRVSAVANVELFSVVETHSANQKYTHSIPLMKNGAYNTDITYDEPYSTGYHGYYGVETSDPAVPKTGFWETNLWWGEVLNARIYPTNLAYSNARHTTVILSQNKNTFASEVKVATSYKVEPNTVQGLPSIVKLNVKILGRIDFKEIRATSGLFGLANGDIFWAQGKETDLDSTPVVFSASEL